MSNRRDKPHTGKRRWCSQALQVHIHNMKCAQIPPPLDPPTTFQYVDDAELRHLRAQSCLLECIPLPLSVHNPAPSPLPPTILTLDAAGLRHLRAQSCLPCIPGAW